MDRHVRSVLMRFIEKVPQEETAIDFHLKEQISRAIQSYALANLKQKNQIVKKDDNTLIHQATGKLENLSTEEKGYEPTKMSKSRQMSKSSPFQLCHFSNERNEAISAGTGKSY